MHRDTSINCISVYNCSHILIHVVFLPCTGPCFIFVLFGTLKVFYIDNLISYREFSPLMSYCTMSVAAVNEIPLEIPLPEEIVFSLNRSMVVLNGKACIPKPIHEYPVGTSPGEAAHVIGLSESSTRGKFGS